VLSWWRRDLEKRLADGEHVHMMFHEHWIRLAEPTAVAFFGVLASLWMATRMPPDSASAARLVLLVGLGFAGWWAVKIVDWYTDYFVVTSKRLINVKGLIKRRFALMPLKSLTDMDYVVTIPGRILGYGQFQVESAGQKQAIDLINYVPNSAEVYRIIMNELFGAGSPGKPKAPKAGADLPVVEPDDPWWTHGD
jgi:uncharacterized membrane protein YdbT with pleckstrin-like domain